MRIVNTMRISKGKAVLHYVDLIVKVFQKNPEITQGVVCVCGEGGEGGGGCWMPIKDIQEWGVIRPKLDVCV